MGAELAQAIVGAVKVGNAVKGIARNVSRVNKNIKKWSTPKKTKKSHFRKSVSNTTPKVPQPQNI